MQCIINMHCIIFFYNSVTPKYAGNVASVEGWEGSVITTFLSANMLGVYTYLYTALLSDKPWKYAVQPSFNPAGSSAWYINLGKVAARRLVFHNVCNFQRYDAGGYATYNGALNTMLLIDSNNMYAYIGAAKEWTATSAVLRISTVLNI